MTYDPRLSGSVLTVGVVSSELPERVNSSGSSLNRTDPVRVDVDGLLQKVDVSVEAQVLSCLGLAKNSVGNLASVGILTQGRLEDVTISGTFGDQMFISKTGGLTHIKPNIGVNGFVAGDFVVSVGIAVKNQTNPLLTDLIVNIRLVGQL